MQRPQRTAGAPCDCTLPNRDREATNSHSAGPGRLIGVVPAACAGRTPMKPSVRGSPQAVGTRWRTQPPSSSISRHVRTRRGPVLDAPLPAGRRHLASTDPRGRRHRQRHRADAASPRSGRRAPRGLCQPHRETDPLATSLGGGAGGVAGRSRGRVGTARRVEERGVGDRGRRDAARCRSSRRPGAAGGRPREQGAVGGGTSPDAHRARGTRRGLRATATRGRRRRLCGAGARLRQSCDQRRQDRSDAPRARSHHGTAASRRDAR